jgi:hypothetical protein
MAAPNAVTYHAMPRVRTSTTMTGMRTIAKSCSCPNVHISGSAADASNRRSSGAYPFQTHCQARIASATSAIVTAMTADAYGDAPNPRATAPIVV